MPFLGLPGVKGEIDGVFAQSITAMLAALKKGSRVASWSGDYGSVNAWIDDAGAYRGAFYCRLATIDEQQFKTRKELHAWLREWRPKCDTRPAIGRHS